MSQKNEAITHSTTKMLDSSQIMEHILLTTNHLVKVKSGLNGVSGQIEK